MNREDHVLDEIDRLVDWQMGEGDQSDSFRGEQFREDVPCPWCVEGWHYLPITQRMWEMRQGSYAVDEFGQGIVDPEYRIEDDTSPILCPGSEFHGPPFYFNGLKLWDKQSRERAAQGSRRVGRSTYTPPVEPYLPAGPIRLLRFHGPFGAWQVSLNDERDIEDIYSDPASVGLPGPRRRVPYVRAQRLTATFTLQNDIRNPTREWLERNYGFIVDGNIRMTPAGTFVTMQDVVIPFRQFTVYAESRTAPEPDWVEFETSYLIEQVPWFAEMWVWSGSADHVMLHPVGHESSDAMIEALTMTREDFNEAYRHRTTRQAQDQSER